MVKELMKTREIEYDNQNGSKSALIEYYILENDADGEKIYGIEVGKKSDDSFENEMVKGVSTSKSAIMKIINLLFENEVTPVSLIYVLDDIQE